MYSGLFQTCSFVTPPPNKTELKKRCLPFQAHSLKCDTFLVGDAEIVLQLEGSLPPFLHKPFEMTAKVYILTYKFCLLLLESWRSLQGREQN